MLPDITVVLLMAALVAQSTAYVVRHQSNVELDLRLTYVADKTVKHEELHLISSHSDDNFTPERVSTPERQFNSVDGGGEIMNIEKKVYAVRKTVNPHTQSLASLESLRGPDVFLSGFTFSTTTKDHERLRLAVLRGQVFDKFMSFNSSSWQFASHDDVKTISRNNSIYSMIVLYTDTNATFGNTTRKGEIDAYYREIAFLETLSASAPDGKTCKLNATIVWLESDFSLVFYNFGKIKTALKEPDVHKSLKLFMGRALGKEIEELLTQSLNKELSWDHNMKEFCKQLQNSTANNFPQPD